MLDSFAEGATFEDAVALYQFDKQLRLLVMDAIEQIEVAARVDIAHHLGAGTLLHRRTRRSWTAGSLAGAWRTQPTGDGSEKLTIATARSREEFVIHYRQKYGLPLPIWVSIEVWDFGLLSRFYEGMKFPDREAMAKRFGVGRADVLVRHAWPESDWALRMADHLKSFPNANTPSIEVDAMGCPANWQAQLLEGS